MRLRSLLGGLNLYICLAASSSYMEHYLYTFMISVLFPRGEVCLSGDLPQHVLTKSEIVGV